jgi:hypothetical protein
MPRKTFTAGEVLAAADVNLYLSNEAVLAASTATTYSLLPANRYQTLVFTAATAAVTVSIGTATAFLPGERVDILRDGAGTLTITSEGAGISIAGRGVVGTAYAIGQRYDAISVVCVDTNSYRIIGNASAV